MLALDCRQLSQSEQALRSASSVHLAFSTAAFCGAALQLVLYLGLPGNAAARALSDVLVRCAAGFFAFRLWTLVQGYALLRTAQH